MTETTITTPSWVQALDKYVASKPIEDVAADLGLKPEEIIMLVANENPNGMSSKVKEAVATAALNLNRYPDADAYHLQKAISEKYGVPQDWVVIGSGSSELLGLAAETGLSEGTTAIYPQYSFSLYPMVARLCGAETIEIPSTGDFNADLDALADAVDERTRLIFLTNPNNPTGRLVDPRVIDATACRCEQAGALLVVDECFLGFAPDARERSVAARAACSRHVAVLSAFTKLYGMAGLRLGYLISGNAQLIEGIRRAGQAWPVSSVAEAAGIAALEDVEYVSRTRDVLAGERAWLSHELSSLGLFVVPSDANFLLVRTPAKDIPERLYKQGVLVRTCDSFSVLSRFWCRVAVRTRKENARLAMAFSRALRAEGASGEGEPDERGGASCSGAMAGADGRGAAKEVDTRV